jgi:ADP-ribose pyrophosphatase YjhB (NUDIX family)
MNFCPACGSPMMRQRKDGRERPVCPQCGHIAFGRFSIGVGGVLEVAGRVLFVQRGHNPGRGRWTLPGGYVEEDEMPAEAVAREFQEEVGLTVQAAELLAVRNSVRERDHNAYYVYRLILLGPLNVVIDGDETTRAEFLTPAQWAAWPDLAPFAAWMADHHAAAPGLYRVRAEQHLIPLTGIRWALYAVSEL